MKKMKSDNMDFLRSLARQRSFQILICVSFIYILFVTVEIPYVFISGLASVSQELPTLARPSQTQLQTGRDLHENQAPSRPHIAVSVNIADLAPSGTADPPRIVSGVNFDRVLGPVAAGYGPFPDLHKSAAAAWKVGRKLWQDLLSGNANAANPEMLDDVSELCPNSISLSGTNFTAQGRVMVLPCGLNLGSHVTVVGKPRGAHAEHDPKISLLREGDQSVMVSQFHMELQGLRTVEGEDPPRIFHFNPRLKGDWSGKPAIEQNTCYRMQWGTAMRCEGWKSKADEETVDGMLKCEKWIRDDDDRSEESKATWWLNRLIGKTRKVTVDWPYPFSEDKLFVMTISAGLEGYHVNVDGRHVTSFPYRTGFALEDATGLSLNGDVDVHSLFAASLPVVHPNYAPHRHLELSSRWKAPALSIQPVEMFIGILSAGNHFAERMAVRKSWLQHKLIASSNVVARFFVALHNRKEVNVELKKEAEFFGDIVIVPYLDNYDLVVLKTVAIFEYGVRTLSARYIMKCDDDTFVRVDAVLDEAKKIPVGSSLYIGNLNYYHKPLRNGKWAVTYEEWPEEEYPAYANGPGYVLSADIARFVVSEFERFRLRLFKMEDVSVGMWVKKFTRSKIVEYRHSYKYCQFGCIKNYYTAHYQSPRQMICMWKKLQETGKPICCNMR